MDRDKLVKEIINLTGCDVDTANEIINLVRDDQHIHGYISKFSRQRPQNIFGQSHGRAEQPQRKRRQPPKARGIVTRSGGSETDDPGPSKYTVRGTIKGKFNV